MLTVEGVGAEDGVEQLHLTTGKELLGRREFLTFVVAGNGPGNAVALINNADGLPELVDDGLAVGGEAARQEAPVLAKPLVEDTGHLGMIEAQQEIAVDGIAGGRPEFLAAFLTQADLLALFLTKAPPGAAELADMHGAAQQDQGDDAQHGGQRVAHTAAGARIGNLAENLRQGAQLIGFEGAAHASPVGLGGGVLGWQGAGAGSPRRPQSASC